jgi:urease accessory protein
VNSVRIHEMEGQGWRAELQLKFAARRDRTCLVSRRHTGPLLVQRPFYPEGNPCHAYIVHPPGGIVGGDELRLEATASDGAQVVLTTPAATKFYRSDGPIARQMQVLTATSSDLEWLPQETIFYPGSLVRSETRIQLGPEARFIGWEIPCLGLPARNEPFDTGELRLNLELWRETTPLLIDRMNIRGDSAARKALWGLAGYEAVGTLLAYPADRIALALTREATSTDVQFAATLVDGVLVCRGVAAQAQPIKELFVAIWRSLRPHLLGRPAVLPRIWAT